MNVRSAAFASLLLFGCDKKTPASGDAPPPKSPGGMSEKSKAQAPEPKPTAPAPADLPICKTAAKDDPLAVVCTLGAPENQARFDCADPSPLMFCGAFDEWACYYLAIAGQEAPPVTYRARFDHIGPPVKTGDIIDDGAFKRTGVVRGVRSQLREVDEAAGVAKAAAWTASLIEWGCTVSDEFGKTKVFSCGSWEASTTYNEIIDDVIFEAALTGFRECKG